MRYSQRVLPRTNPERDELSQNYLYFMELSKGTNLTEYERNAFIATARQYLKKYYEKGGR